MAINVIISTDLDGTLLKNDTSVSKENINAIKRMSDKGIKTVILTGRTFYEIPAELRLCRGVEYFVYSNGAGINSRAKGAIDYNPIPKETAVKVFNILSRYETLIELYSNGHPRIEKSKYNSNAFKCYKIDPNYIPEMYKSRMTVNCLEELLYDETYKIEMFNVFFKNSLERTECKNSLRAEFDGLEVTTSMTNNLEIIDKGINKGFGLKRLCEISNLNIDDIIVIGDSKNDITAFKAAKKKYAVSNACEEIKRISDKIICSNEDNIMCYMEKELL